MRLRLFALSAAFILVSCGGGSAALPKGAAAGTAPSPTTAPAPTATPAATPAPSAGANSVKMTIAFSTGKKAAHARHVQFISPSTQSIKITINSVNGSSPPSSVSPNPQVQNLITSGAGQNCTVITPSTPSAYSTETCTLYVLAAPGSVNYTFDLYDGLNAAGNKVGTKTATFTIAQGQTNTLSVGFQGIVSWVSFEAGEFSASAATPGQSSSEPMYFWAYDEDDNQINNVAGAANFNNPIGISISDAANAMTLSVGSSPSCPGTTTVTVNSPSDSVWVCYTGEATGTATISAAEAAGGPTGENLTGEGSVSTVLNAIQFSGATICDTTAGCATTDPNYNQPTVFLQYPGTAQTFSASELGWTQSPYDQQFDLSLDPATCNPSGSAVVTATTNPATSWTITPQTTGICKGTVTEHLSSGALQASTVWFSVTSGQIQGFTKRHAP